MTSSLHTYIAGQRQREARPRELVFRGLSYFSSNRVRGYINDQPSTPTKYPGGVTRTIENFPWACFLAASPVHAPWRVAKCLRAYAARARLAGGFSCTTVRVSVRVRARARARARMRARARASASASARARVTLGLGSGLSCTAALILKAGDIREIHGRYTGDTREI